MDYLKIYGEIILFKHIKSLFNKCSYVKPEASDKSSKEIYILGLEKK